MTDGVKRKVLVVDDEPSIAKILRKQLEVAGFDVAVAVDGEDGLAKVRESKPELLLLDVMLPNINGYEVCKTLKADPELKSLPIIILTAKAQRQDQDLAQPQGADAFLTKPFQLSELLAKVKVLLGQAASG